jgi:predicted transglutaminase-like cysteine proteinase
MTIGFARGTWGSTFTALAVLGFAGLAFGTAPVRASEPVSAPSLQVRLFGSNENANHDISPFPKWTGMLQRYAREQHLEDAPCAGERCQLQDWKAFVVTLKGQDRLTQLRAVNAYANRIPYRSDLDRHGVADYWSTPRETLGRSADCEDYAIIKYLSLRKLGWSASDLRIVVLKHEVRNELHAVLVAYVGGTAYVLDNLIPDVREHAAIRYYRPIFSINETAWHYHRDWNPASAVMVAKAEPARAPQGQARMLAAPVPMAAPAPATQIAAPMPPAFDTVKARTTYQPPLVRPAARSYAANASESLASLFTNAGSAR